MPKKTVNFVLAILAVVTIALAPLVVGKMILRAYGMRFGNEEVRSNADRYLVRAERILAEAVSALRDVDRRNGGSCATNDLVLLGETTARSQYLRRLGVVDRQGYAMCLYPAPAARRGAVLPPIAEGDRQVTLTLLDPERVTDAAPGTLMVAWRSANGARLVAEVAASALDLDPGPEYLRVVRHVVVTIDGAKTWIGIGQPPSSAADGEMIRAVARSATFPVEVMVEVPVASALEIVTPLEITLSVATMAAGVVLGGIVFWMFFRPVAEVDDEFLTALQREEFKPFYQPVMNIDTGRIEGCEVLVRWVKPDGKVVSPGAFMTYAETSGHVFEMTRQLMRKTREELGPLFGDHPELKISINLFAGHFDDRRILEDIVSIFEGGRISYDQLVFEVTERYPLRDIDKARKIIAEMHVLGCRVALDDTGTGHGGLAYLQQLGIDIVKIDKMFIDAMGTDLGASTIVDVLVELANSLGMGIVAEGVEREDQLQRLREKGVTAAQGYIFAPPLPGKMFIELASALLGEGEGTPAAEAGGPEDRQAA